MFHIYNKFLHISCAVDRMQRSITLYVTTAST
jgi:hypothetical protein